jgi:hypothetical protein
LLLILGADVRLYAIATSVLRVDVAPQSASAGSVWVVQRLGGQAVEETEPSLKKSFMII